MFFFFVEIIAFSRFCVSSVTQSVNCEKKLDSFLNNSNNIYRNKIRSSSAYKFLSKTEVGISPKERASLQTTQTFGGEIMKLSYRGIEYCQSSAVITGKVDKNLGKYRGQKIQIVNFDGLPVKQTHSSRIYRGVSYS